MSDHIALSSFSNHNIESELMEVKRTPYQLIEDSPDSISSLLFKSTIILNFVTKALAVRCQSVYVQELIGPSPAGD